MRDFHNRRREPMLVSACLLGLCTRFDGKDCRSDEAVAACEDCVPVPVCPEQLGGLPTPRPPAEIERGDGRDVLAGTSRILNEQGADVTAQFLQGARATADIARLLGIRRALLKEGSPSCGVRRIKRGERDLAGGGVTAVLLQHEGVRVQGVE
jgi:uncharacterized protein YbbK (DUF523 family)